MLTAGPPPAGRAVAATRVAVVAVATTLVVQAIASFGVLAIAAIAPEVARALGLPASLVGYQISIAYTGAAVSSLMAGGWVRRWGPCRGSQICLVLVGAGSLICALPYAAAVVTGSAVIGLGYGCANPAASTLLIRFAPPRRRNLIFSIKQTGVPLGGILAGLIAPPVVLAFGWQMAPVTVAVGALVLAALLEPAHAIWDTDLRAEARFFGANPFEGLGLVWRLPALRWLSNACFWFSFVQLSLVGFLVTLLVEEIGFTLVQAGFLLSLAQASGAVGRMAWGWVADRVRNGLAVQVAIGALMMLAALATAMLTPEWPASTVQAVIALFGATAIGWNGVYIAEIARLAPPGDVSLATGGSLSIIFLGVTVGPSVFAAAYATVGSYTLTFTLLAAAALAGSLSAWRAHRLAPARAAPADTEPRP